MHKQIKESLEHFLHLFSVCVYAGVYLSTYVPGTHMHVALSSQLVGVSFLFLSWGFGDRAHEVRLGNKFLYPLRVV